MEKITLAEIAEGLAKRKSMTKKDAEAFARVVFETIKDNIFSDELVKVKGLGTFKQATVESRESVNVNTGERIVIESHTKISFTPDKTLSDRVNKPFADFETVVLNDETSTEEMENIEPEVQNEPEVQAEAEVPEKPEIPVEPETSVNPEAEIVTITEKPVEPETVSGPEPEPAVAPEPEVVSAPEPTPSLEPAPEAVAPVDTDNTEDGGSKKGYAWVFVLLLLVAGALYWLYTNGYLNLSKQPAKAESPTEQVVEEPAAVTDTTAISDITVTAAPNPAPVAASTAKADPATLAADYPQIENGEYWITGQKTVHVLEKGEDLSVLAKKYYDDKRLISYIIRFNHYTNSQASNLFVGAEVKIPELVKRN